MYRPAKPDSTLILLHIPKTAGTTLAIMLIDRYGQDQTRAVTGGPDGRVAFGAEDASVRGAPKLYIGHQPFGLHEHVPRPCEYVTFVRDPVARLISHYHHVRNEPSHYLHLAVISGDMPLEAYIENPFPTRELDNSQTRMLANYGLERSKLPRKSDRSLLESAKENLDQWFCCVGLTERFDESMVLLADSLGWDPLPPYLPARVSANKGREPLADRVRDRIRELNALDVALYEHIRARFESRVAALGQSMDERLAKIREANAHVAEQVAAQSAKGAGAPG